MTPAFTQSIVLGSPPTFWQFTPGPMPAPPKRVKRIVVGVSKTAIWSISPGVGGVDDGRTDDVEGACLCAPDDAEHEDEREQQGANQHARPFFCPGSRHTIEVAGSAPSLIAKVYVRPTVPGRGHRHHDVCARAQPGRGEEPAQ